MSEDAEAIVVMKTGKINLIYGSPTRIPTFTVLVPFMLLLEYQH